MSFCVKSTNFHFYLICKNSFNDDSEDKIRSSTLHNIKPDEKGDLNVLTIIVSVIGSVSLIVFISIIVYLLIRVRNLKRIAVESNLENYDDIRESEKYDTIYDVNEYALNYEEVIDYRVGNEGTDKHKAIIHQKEEKNSIPIYLAIE
jgi:hypothetical protein